VIGYLFRCVLRLISTNTIKDPNQLHGPPSAGNSLITDRVSFSPRTVDVTNQSDSDISLVHTKGGFTYRPYQLQLVSLDVTQETPTIS
jgi:hypothetical protein